MTLTSTTTIQKPSAERTSEILESLAEIRQRVKDASADAKVNMNVNVEKDPGPLLVAVSKYKPSSDILVCYEHGGQLDFGENYVQELVDKAKELPTPIRWHFIGTFQSNKSKLLASIPNLHTVQTISSTKSATALNKALASLPKGTRESPVNVLIQVNTSGEESKGGLRPLSWGCVDVGANGEETLRALTQHIILSCPYLHFQGLMTIGALELSLSATETEKNADFERLKETRDVLEAWLGTLPLTEGDKEVRWGVPVGSGRKRKLILSMGMSSDFEAAIKAGSDVVRVGTGVFGARKRKGEV